jgi:hypothetical protein
MWAVPYATLSAENAQTAKGKPLKNEDFLIFL